MEIRKARKEDSSAIIEFLKQVGSESDNLSFGKEGLNLPKEAVENYIQGVECYYVAKEGDKIIGSSQLDKGRRRFSHKAEFAISVLKDYWGKGVSTALFNTVLDYAKANGIRKINLEVRKDNLRAINFYKKHGFQYEGTDKRMFKINDEFIDGEYYGLLLD